METSKKFPAEGPRHFEQYLRNIKGFAAQLPNRETTWASVDQFGVELGHSLQQGKVTSQEAEEFRKKISQFMSEGDNRANYESVFPEMATYWWEENNQPDEQK